MAELLYFSGFFSYHVLLAVVGMTWLDYKINSVSCVIGGGLCCLLLVSALSRVSSRGWWVGGGGRSCLSEISGGLSQ